MEGGSEWKWKTIEMERLNGNGRDGNVKRLIDKRARGGDWFVKHGASGGQSAAS
jgi:hypothetical protein